MKKKLYLLSVLATALLFSINLSAQHCSAPSDPSVCTPQSGLTVQGFYPNYFDLPCAIDGVPYDTVISFKAPLTTLYSGLTATIDWIRMDSIENLPCGLCWRTNLTRDSLTGGQTACILISGTTFDAPGQFKMRIIIDVKAHVSFISQTLVNQDAEQFGIKYWAKVKATASAPDILIDTLSTTGNNQTTPGVIAAVSISGNNSVCSGNTTTLTATGGTYDAYAWSTGEYTSSITAGAGTYTVTVYANCNSATATKTITTNTVTASITPSGPTTFCSGGSVSLDAGTFASYLWSTNATSQSINVSQSGNYTCTVTQGGCQGTTNTVTVTVNANPTPTITPGSSTTFCPGGSVSLDAGAGYASYLWSTAETTQSINTTQSGNYTCTVTQNGCTGTSNTVTVTVNNNPAPTVTANGPTTFCAGGSVTLDAGTGYSNYLWSNNATTQTISPTQSGNYICTVTQNGCTGGSDTVTVTVNSLPTPVITPSGSTAICMGDSVTLDAGAGYNSYFWTNHANTQMISPSTAGNYTCTVTQNGCNGTSNTVTVTVTDPTPTITPSGPTTFCDGGSVTLNAGAGFSNYAWSDTTSGQTTIATTSGTYTVTTTLNGCVGTSSPVVVTVTTNNLNPTIGATPSLNICPGGSATLDAGLGYDTYTWNTASTSQSITENTAATYEVTVTQGTCSGTASATLNVGNFPIAVSITPPGPIAACAGDIILLDAGVGFDTYVWNNSDNTPMINVTATGTYIVTVTSNSCIGIDSVDVTISNALQPAISPTSPIVACVGDVVTLDAGAGFAAYSWSNSSTSQTIQPTSTGSYAVTVSQNGCTGSDTVQVTFNAHPVVTITPAGPITTCANTPVTLDAGAGFATYNWSNTDQTQTTQTSSSGAYQVTVTQNGCDGTASVAVTVNPVPLPTITPAGPINACVGDNVILDAGSGYTAYSWSNGDLTQTTQPTSSGNYVVTVNQNGCFGSDSVAVIFNAIPHAVISPADTQAICSGQSIMLDAGAGYSSYLWTTSDTTQTIVVDSTGTYDVTVTQNGCTGGSTAAVDVVVNLIPNAQITLIGNVVQGIVLQAEPNGGSYQWFFEASNFYFPSGQNQIDTADCAHQGYYYVIVTANGCIDTSAAYPWICGGINSLASEINFSVKPNPATDVLNVSYDLNKSSAVVITIVDLAGRRIMNVLNETQISGKHNQTIRLNDLASGIYLLNFTTEFGSLNSKFVKE